VRLPGRLWLKDRVAGIEWQHRLVSYATLCRLADGECYAVSVEADRAVYYHEDESDDSLKLAYCHETHHRPSMVPGERHHLEKIYGTTDDEEYEDREESAATYYGRIYAETMGQWIKLPKPPRKKKRAA
jgi:hypothetical protein